METVTEQQVFQWLPGADFNMDAHSGTAHRAPRAQTLPLCLSRVLFLSHSPFQPINILLSVHKITMDTHMLRAIPRHSHAHSFVKAWYLTHTHLFSYSLLLSLFPVTSSVYSFCFILLNIFFSAPIFLRYKKTPVEVYELKAQGHTKSLNPSQVSVHVGLDNKRHQTPPPSRHTWGRQSQGSYLPGSPRPPSRASASGPSSSSSARRSLLDDEGGIDLIV